MSQKYILRVITENESVCNEISDSHPKEICLVQLEKSQKADSIKMFNVINKYVHLHCRKKKEKKIEYVNNHHNYTGYCVQLIFAGSMRILTCTNRLVCDSIDFSLIDSLTVFATSRACNWSENTQLPFVKTIKINYN